MKEADDRLNDMIVSLVEWFEEEVGGAYGGEDCSSILQGDMANRKSVARRSYRAYISKRWEILADNGYDLM